MNNIFVPEQSKNILRAYHFSSKALIPVFLGSFISYKLESKPIEKIFYTLNTLNIGFHSYVSTSCVITDYIKPTIVARSTRGLSLGLHGIAIYGYLNNIYKK